MAHGLSPNSASSQFYITLSPQPSLDGKYAIFGGVMSGMDVVRSIVKGDKMTTVSVQMP
jgi:cyclophilin family peptidyl-prolyl cis-trans isomerase